MPGDGTVSTAQVGRQSLSGHSAGVVYDSCRDLK
jgi:hypothetical protein